MKEKTITIKSKEELQEMTADNVRFDVALKARMDSIDKTIKELTAEMNKVKDIAKQVFGKNGGNDVFSTSTSVQYLLNMDELSELIGTDKIKELKNVPSPRTSVKW